jgi:phosphopantothenoylcysteine decarboxylase
MEKKTVVLGVTGSISAYKAADIISRLTKLNYNVEVIMTRAAQEIIPALTLQVLSKNIVHTDVFAEPHPDKVNHIEEAKHADLFLIAPASANIVGKLANGIADDMLSTVAMAIPMGVPRLIAPAMNTEMYANPIFQRNLATIKALLGFEEIEPRVAMLACGDSGRGALATVDDIVEVVYSILK